MPRVMLLDLKGDTRWTLAYPQVLDLAHLDFSPIACPTFATPTEFISNFQTNYNEVFWGAALQTAALTPSLEALVRPGHVASLADLQDQITLRDKSPAGKGAVQRLDSIRLAFPLLFHSKKNLWHALHDASIYAGIEGPLTPAARFVFWLLVTERFRYLRAIGHRDQIHTAIFLDESPSSLGRRQQTISGQPPTPVQLLPVTREHGIQFNVATPSWTELDPLILSQFSVQVLLQVSDGRELEAISKSFRFTPAQATFAAGMPRGTAVGKVRGIEHAFAFTYEPFPNKTITPDVLAKAYERTSNYCIEQDAQSPVTPVIAPNRASVAATGAMGSQLATLSPSPAPTSAAPVEQPPIALNTNETRLAEYLLIQRVQLATVAYNDLKLHPQAGTRAKNKLLTLGFITAEPVIAHPGRGGTGVALRPTPSLHGRFNHRHIHGVRGPTSVQHEFLIHEIARCLALVVIEVTVGTKAVDIYVKNYHETQAAVLSAVRDAAHHFTPTTRETTPIESFAIEVETSDARKTAPNNAEKNFAAGIPLTIIAPMPSEFTAAVRALEKLPEHLQQHTIAIDVFVLLNLVREHRTREVNA